MSPAAQIKETTYAPTKADAPALAVIHDFLGAHRPADKGDVAPRYLLAGAETEEQVEIPGEVYRVLLQVIDAMSQGLAVTVMPESQRLTTQQAAELLGVTRPTLIRLLDAGKIPFERVGKHRRLFLHDVLDYREQRREEQYRFLEETAVPIDEEDDVADILAAVREARKSAR